MNLSRGVICKNMVEKVTGYVTAPRPVTAVPWSGVWPPGPGSRAEMAPECWDVSTAHPGRHMRSGRGPEAGGRPPRCKSSLPRSEPCDPGPPRAPHADFLAGMVGRLQLGTPRSLERMRPRLCPAAHAPRSGPTYQALPRGTQRWWPSSETRGWTPPGNVQTTSADPRGRCCGHGSQQRGIAVGTSTITAKVYSASAGSGRCSRAFRVPSPVLLVTACPVVVLLSSCCAEETEAQRCFRHSSQSHIWRTAEPGFQPR